MKDSRDILDLLEMSEKSLEAASDLLKGGHFGFSASRSYYAMFYAAEAVLLTKDLSFSKHKAVISAFGKEFIKSGFLPPQLHRYLADAFKLRQLGDYGPPRSVDKKKAQGLLEQTKEFIEVVKEYLKREGYVI